MNRSALSVIVSVGLIFLPSLASAQSTVTKLKAPLDSVVSKDKSNAKTEAERLPTERRAQVQSFLISLASDARSFRDQELRARSAKQSLTRHGS
jgi:hypothetical protein